MGFPGHCWRLTAASADQRRARGGRGGWEGTTYVDGAAEERAFLQSLLDDLEQVGRGLPQLVPLGDASGEVLEALGGGAPRERFVAPVDPTEEEGTPLAPGAAAQGPLLDASRAPLLRCSLPWCPRGQLAVSRVISLVLCEVFLKILEPGSREALY